MIERTLDTVRVFFLWFKISTKSIWRYCFSARKPCFGFMYEDIYKTDWFTTRGHQKGIDFLSLFAVHLHLVLGAVPPWTQGLIIFLPASLGAVKRGRTWIVRPGKQPNGQARVIINLPAKTRTCGGIPSWWNLDQKSCRKGPPAPEKATGRWASRSPRSLGWPGPGALPRESVFFTDHPPWTQRKLPLLLA